MVTHGSIETPLMMSTSTDHFCCRTAIGLYEYAAPPLLALLLRLWRAPGTSSQLSPCQCSLRTNCGWRQSEDVAHAVIQSARSTISGASSECSRMTGLVGLESGLLFHCSSS